MGRRTGDETRELLLRTGMEMLLARGVSAGVGHIRLQEVVQRAQLTTGAAYRLWADQDHFHRDLAIEVTRYRDVGSVELFRAVADDPRARGGGLDRVIRLAAAAHVQSLAGDRSRSSRVFLVALALRASSRCSDGLNAASAERHLDSVGEFAEVYGSLMRAHGYRMRAPLTVLDFAEAVAAMGEGFALQEIQGIPHPVFGPSTDGADVDLDLSDGPWTLLGLTIRALVASFMVREERDGDRPSRVMSTEEV